MGVVVTDQCASTTGWINASPVCLAHVQRNLQEMAEYSGGGQTAYLGRRLVLLFKSVFRTQHSYGLNNSLSHCGSDGCRLRRSIRVL